jgi:serine/threonine protein kinase
MLTEIELVRVLDFGIAQALGRTPVDEPVGTAEYLSPEQTTGLPVDGRSDVYSLGVVQKNPPADIGMPVRWPLSVAASCRSAPKRPIHCPRRTKSAPLEDEAGTLPMIATSGHNARGGNLRAIARH